jgi:hypothetical protein
MGLDSSTPALSQYAYYVQLPASGGGFQDLIVAAMGLPQNEVVGLVQQVVAQYQQGATGQPPLQPRRVGKWTQNRPAPVRRVGGKFGSNYTPAATRWETNAYSALGRRSPPHSRTRARDHPPGEPV